MPIRVLIAPDSLKGSLTASQAAMAMKRGVLRALPQASVEVKLISDGGENAVELWSASGKGTAVLTDTVNALGDKIKAPFIAFEDGKSAWIELSQASGLHLIHPSAQTALNASTFGTGLLVKRAVERGCTHLTVGLGGSATTDGGAGLLSALGFSLLDAYGRPVPLGGAALAQVETIVPPAKGQGSSVVVEVACDVDNVLAGSYGAAAVYGPQKGAGPEQVAQLDAALSHWGEVLERTFGTSVANVPGAGAAGGTAAGLMAGLGARLKRGFELVSERIQLESSIVNAQLVLTAEGALDAQSLSGKATVSLAHLARAHRVPVWAFAGRVDGHPVQWAAEGLERVTSIRPSDCSIAESISRAAELLEEQVYRELKTIKWN